MNKVTNNVEPSLSGVMEILRGIKNDTNSTSNSLSQYMQTMDSKVEAISTTVKVDSDRISILEKKIAEMERSASVAPVSNELAKQSNLRNNICLHGIPLVDTCSLDTIVTAVGSALGIQLSSSDYQSVYRTTGNGNLPGFIIVKLNEFSKKLEILKAKRSKSTLSLKDLNLNILPEGQIIFVNNQLTPHFSKLLQIAKKAVADKKLHSCWIALNCLCVKLSENSERTLVRDMTELQKAINGPPKSATNIQSSVSGTQAPATAKNVPTSNKNGKRRASNETITTQHTNPAKKPSTIPTNGKAQTNETEPN